MDLSRITENYSQLPENKLLKIVDDHLSLRPEVIPILKEELNKRGLNNAITKIKNEVEGTLDYSILSIEQIQTIVAERIHSGEPIESIKEDFSDSGVNIFDYLNEEWDNKEKLYEALSNNTELTSPLLQNLKEDEIVELKSNMYKRANSLLFIGLILVVLSIVFYTNGSGLKFPTILIISGGSLIFKGFKQSEKK